MSALNAASKRLLDTAFPNGGAYLVVGHYDANDKLAIRKEGPSGSFDLPDDHDLYYCVSGVAPGGDRNRVERVHVLVIDDVGKELEGYDMMPFLPVPSFVVESSEGSFQYGYIIEGGMAPADYDRVRAAMKASPVYGRAHGIDAARIFRLPQGTHTKSVRKLWKVRLVKWTGLTYTEAQVVAAAGAPVGAPAARAKKFVWTLPEAALQELVDIIPNPPDIDRDRWIAVMHGIMGAGGTFEMFDGWSAKWQGDGKGDSYDPAKTQSRWDTVNPANVRSGGGLLRQLAEEMAPAAFAAWRQKWETATVFNDDGGAPGGGLPRALQLKYAREIAKRWGAGMRYVLDRKAWAEFDGDKWNHMPSGVKLGGQYALEMAEKAPPKGKGDHDVTTLSFLDGVEGICRQIPELQCRETDFDSNPLLLGTPKGTVDLKTGALVPARAADMISKSTICAPAATALCPRWLKFLEEITEKDDESILFLQQYAGYCLTGLTIEEKLLFLFGPGGNGKSKFADILAWVMGKYFVKPAPDMFIKKVHGMGHTSKLAMLAGARLCTISEVPAGAQWDEGLLKDVTGGGAITAGFKHKDEFTFEPQFKLLAYGNHQPTFPGGIDDAIRRRFLMMEFRFKADPPDLELFGKLQKEGPGILRWMIEGCLSWQKMQLMKPAKVEAATNAMFTEQDLMGRWIAGRIDSVKGSTVGATDLFNDWKDWCHARGEHEQVGTATSFGRELVDRRGFKRQLVKAGTVYQDIKLKAKTSDVFND